jgi:Na+-transporting NADH:ubiquinone oxidoreductase subunit NqrF
MKTKLKFTEKEKKAITKSVMALTGILLLKMQEGVEAPTIQGKIEVDNDDKEVVFTITARKKYKDKLKCPHPDVLLEAAFGGGVICMGCNTVLK